MAGHIEVMEGRPHDPTARRAALHALLDSACDAVPAVERALEACLEPLDHLAPEQRDALLDILSSAERRLLGRR